MVIEAIRENPRNDLEENGIEELVYLEKSTKTVVQINIHTAVVQHVRSRNLSLGVQNTYS